MILSLVRMALIPASVGVALIVISTVLYSFTQMSIVTPERAEQLVRLAYVYLAVLLSGFAIVALDLRRLLDSKVDQITRTGKVPLLPRWLIPYILSLKKYRRFFAVSTLLYGVLFAVVTSMVVYQPTVDFVKAYSATFPSIVVSTCCGSPMSIPVVTVYVVNHFGLLLVPSTLLLLLIVAPLVGVNVVLAAFAYDSRAPGASRYWLGGLGGAVGLFTGCPTCAGFFLASVIGGSGAVSLAMLLAYYQPGIIAASIPLMTATLYLVSRRLSKVFTNGCVLLDRRDGKPHDIA